MTRWFAVALFLSAALLFSVEPLVGKMLTPLVGGAIAVWITAMLFFQALLLAGYVYAHASIRYLTPRVQIALHLALLFLTIFFLPITIAKDAAASWPTGANPAPHVLLLLMKTVGIPFFVLSSSAPILKHWFSKSAKENDPYYLYIASNLGSVLALAAYPIAIEPHLGLAAQSGAWRWGFLALVLVFAGCGGIASRRAVPDGKHVEDAPAEILTWRRRAFWTLLAFVPSAYLLGVTSYVTQDVAALPLFWVLPLLLYLLTFVVVFARKPIISLQISTLATPAAVSLCMGVIALHANSPLVAVTAFHMVAFFLTALVCHGRLAADRPSAAHLTEFYLWLSIGGALGGLFAALVAPALFDSILEYPIALVLGAACRPPRNADGGKLVVADAIVPIVLGALVAVAVVVLARMGKAQDDGLFELVLLVAVFVNYRRTDRPVRFALGIGAILIGAAFHDGPLGHTVYAERNFYGVLRVTRDPTGKFLRIIDGDTVHGTQSTDPKKQRTPLAYYASTGPLGEVMERLHARASTPHLALVGLGAGATTTYARPGEPWDIYELNPAVVVLAEDPHYFTYVSDSFPNKGDMHVIVGDARIDLAHAEDHTYDLVVLDAFSSDTIPVHLLTREAFELYMRKLAPGGVLALHISNRFVDLAPVLSRVASAMHLDIRVRDDRGRTTPEQMKSGVIASIWAICGRDASALSDFSELWKAPKEKPDQRLWTDDFSSVLSVFSKSER
ncbi:MAG: fused MFS/spermidine synthase [Polyangiaceae bacterium]